MYSKKFKYIYIFIIIFILTIFVNSYDYSHNQSPSIEPPGNLLIEQVPQFVTIGFDDNGYSGAEGSNGKGGLTWVNSFFKGKKNPPGEYNPFTYDNENISVSLFLTSVYIAAWCSESPALIKREWRRAYENGFEIGSHSFNHPHGEIYTLLQWEKQLKSSLNWITKPYDPHEDFQNPDYSKGIGVPLNQIYGFRTPFLEYNNYTFQALKNYGFLYDCSIEDGYQSDQNGKNYLWPYTLDNGSPGHEFLYTLNLKRFELDNHPGLWEVPVNPVIVPADDKCNFYGLNYSLRNKLKNVNDYFDDESGKISGIDYNLWVHYKMSKKEFLATLKNTLDLRYAGNRAPFVFEAHSDEYSTKYTSPPNADTRQRQQAIEEFINYSLRKKDVRFVNVKKIIDWCKNPYPLGKILATPTPFVTPGPSGKMPTPTPTVIPAPTVTPIKISELINIAIGKKIKTSSDYSDKYSSGYINDDNDKTIWGSKYNPSGYEWFYIDLDKITDIKGIRIKWVDKFHASKYTIGLSNDKINWNFVYKASNQKGGVKELVAPKTVNCRYIALTFLDGNKKMYALKEFEVFVNKKIIKHRSAATPAPTPLLFK